jgi:hypothetical protein
VTSQFDAKRMTGYNGRFTLLAAIRIPRHSMSKSNTEAALRDWIASHIDQLRSLVVNFDEAKAAKETAIRQLSGANFSTIEQLAAGALTAALNRKVLSSLKALDTGLPLISLGTEIPLLESQNPGRKPAADILALQTGSAAYVLVEVKITANAAREAVTELSAYASGLGQRFWGMSSFDSIWLLISTEYRPTLSAAVAYQLLVSGHCVVPLRADVNWREGDVESLTLTVEEVASVPDNYTCDSLFCDSVFDCVAARFEAPISAPGVACHFIASAFERTGASGCCFQLLDDIGHTEAQKPHGVVSLTLNPFRLRLKAIRLRELVERGLLARGTTEYTREILDNHFLVDVDADLGTFRSVLINGADEDVDAASEIAPDRSLRELAEREPNSQLLAFEAVMEQLAISHSYEVHMPYLGDWLSPLAATPQLREDNIVAVRYFGAVQDIMIECAHYLSRRDADFAGMPLTEIYESSQLLLKMFGKIALNIQPGS